MTERDKIFMEEAIKLGRKGTNLTSPNPRVGCLIVKNGKIEGRGFHKKCGGPHAEVEALKDAGKKACGATVYLTLEPCTHKGRRPACAPQLLRAGVKRVIFAARDITLKKSGAEYLKEKGVEVKGGILKEKAEKLIQNFNCYNQRKRPFVTVKTALSWDGKIASASGRSRWISSTSALRYTMLMRGNSDAILIGRGTADIDDPLLTYRLSEPPAAQPLRVIVDGNFKINENLRIIGPGTLLITSFGCDPEKKRRIEQKGASVAMLEPENGRIKASEILKELYLREITSLLIEGGGETAWIFFSQKMVDEVVFIYGSLILGGKSSPTACGGEGFKSLNEAVRLENVERFALGESFVMRGETA